MEAILLRVHNSQRTILVAGDQEAVAVSPSGSAMTTVEDPAPPMHRLFTADFSNDGLTDLILVTPNGFYGFVQTRQREPGEGALFFGMLVPCLKCCDESHICHPASELDECKTSSSQVRPIEGHDL